MNDKANTRIRLAAVGDLILVAGPGRDNPGRGIEALSEDIRRLFSDCDVVFGNLECTLPGSGTVSSEPRLVSTATQIETLRGAGFDVVSLANNHTFDCLDEGFHRLRDALTDMGIRWFGAGDDLEEALEPAMVQVKGITLAFIGVVDATSGASRFAGPASSGVAPNDPDIVCPKIKKLRGEADHVIVSPHWGDERFRFPSPRQIRQAHAFVDAGASMVLGHHPHVLQGLEIYRGKPIIYSLGNFLSNPVHYTNGDVLVWDRFERASCILLADINKSSIDRVRQVPVFDDGHSVSIDRSGWTECCIRRANRLLAGGVTDQQYSREAFRVRKVKPIIDHLCWDELKRLRPAKVISALRLLMGRK